MIYLAIGLIVLAVCYGIDLTYNCMMREAKRNDPKIIMKLKIPFYSTYAYYKWRKEIKNGQN